MEQLLERAISHCRLARQAMARPQSHSNAMAQCDPSNILYELKEMKYLLAERIQVEEANNRNLTCYTFGRIDHETIRASITAVMMEIRRARGERANMDELAIKGLRPRDPEAPRASSCARRQ